MIVFAKTIFDNELRGQRAPRGSHGAFGVVEIPPNLMSGTNQYSIAQRTLPQQERAEEKRREWELNK